jgi:chaperone modulatory protein CbpM
MPRKLNHYTFEEACQEAGLQHELFVEFVRHHWIVPATPGVADPFDEEDIARARLIAELRDQFGVNDEAVPIILHLLDQVYALHRRLKSA